MRFPSLYKGGTDDNWTAYCAVEQYDPLTETWLRLPDMQCPRIHPSVTCHTDHTGTKLYVFGGRNSKKVELKSAEVYDPLTNEWTLLEEGMKVSIYSSLKLPTGLAS